MSRYWTGTTKILLLVGIPCIISTYTIAVIPRNLYWVSDRLNLGSGVGWKSYFSEWCGTIVTLSILVFYSLVSHILYCCKCCKSSTAIIYCYLVSIGVGYCAFVDLFFCILAPSIFSSYDPAFVYIVTIGDFSKYAMLSVGIAWLFTVTAGALLLNTESICLQVLTPMIGSLISFGLPLFIVLTSYAGLQNRYSYGYIRFYLVASFVLAFLSLACYLLAYFVEFQKKKILNRYDVFGGSSTSFGRTPTSSTTVLSTAHDSSMYRGYSNDAYSYA